jgi:DsbC/DsbD-like thiol-disulfide interchange protein
MTLSVGRSARSVSALAVAGLVAVAPAAAVSDPDTARHVRVSLLADTDGIAPGRPLLVGVRLQMDGGWHTYWRNPGDAGLATRLRWSLPEGFAAGEVQWPAPERFVTGPVASYGYVDDVLLPVEVRVPAALARPDVRLAARVDWLECREACRPGRAELTLTLPVERSPRPSPSAPLFTEARRRLPAPATGWGVTASAEPPALVLFFRPPPGEKVKSASFYPLAPRVLDHASPQPLERTPRGRYRLRLVRDLNGVPVERLTGVLVVDVTGGRRALNVDVRVSAPATRTTRS